MEKAGPDYILNECLKNSIDIMLHYLHALFNKNFDIDYFPDICGMVSLFRCTRNEVLKIWRIIEKSHY